ncbi:MAG: ABC transporter ATP-binding protein [Spirochaetota bacterium]|nr:ABC transporter ATP-binding protein [Spirochaetota bacterium]
MLELKNLSIQLNKFNLNNINISINESECHVIVGPTGSGKTLLLESIIGFRKPNYGDILLNNQSIIDLSVEKRNISYVPQDLAIFPHLNVEDNINYGLYINKHKCMENNNLTNELINSLNIKHLLKRSTNNLSGGERQRVALTRALAPGRKVLVLDEPLSSLHESMKRDLWFILKDLQKKYKLTILMVTHDLEEAFFLGDTVSIIIDGTIYQTGNKTDIYYHPKSTKVARFLGIRNIFEVELKGINNNKITVYNRDFNINLNITNNANPLNEKIQLMAGIRSDEIMILRPGYEKQNQDNLLTGNVISVFNKGAYHTILFSHNDSKKVIEIEIPNYAFQKLNPATGKEITITLKAENIFLMTQ